MATSVLPSPVFISAILPLCSTMPPISCTSKCRMFSTRRPGLAHDGKRLDQQVVERLAVGDALPELRGLVAELLVGERLDLRLERADLRDARVEALELALVLGADDLGEELTDHA